MGPDTLIFIVVLVVLGAVSIIKKLKEAVDARVEGGQQAHVDYEATPTEIQEFLRSIGSGQRQGAAVQAREPDVVAQARPAGPGRAAAPQGARARPIQRPVAGRSLWDALESPVPRAPARVPQLKPLQRKRARRQAPARPAAEAPKPAAAPEPEKGKAPAALTSMALKGMDLKQAVVWAEILAPPLSLRRRPTRR